jgi:hypothetical protein
MSSRALQSLLIALEEVGDLQRANPTPTGAAPSQPETTRAIGRASVVLLSSHLERYIRNLNEEAVEFVNSAGVMDRPSLNHYVSYIPRAPWMTFTEPTGKFRLERPC